MSNSGKLCSLAKAVADFVHAGDTIHYVFTHNRSHAAVWEVARQFRDSRSLDLVATGLLEYASVLCAAGAIRNMESAFAGNTYPSPSPSRVLIQHFDEHAQSDPNWTNLTMTLRLMAGALGWPFIPTHSLAGSDLEHGPGRACITDPFTGSETFALAPLNPDVAFVHAALADETGNAVIYGPDAEELWGALAADRVIVTAERIVTTQQLRELGPRPGLPGHCVTAVVHAPYGAHPQPQFVWNESDDVQPYTEDYAFRQELRKLSRDPDALRSWVEEWIFSIDDHTGYLKRLGDERLKQLHQMTPPVQANAQYDEVTPEERAAVMAMRQAVQVAQSGTHTTFFAGIGLSHIAAWAAESLCRQHGFQAQLVAETGMYGFLPYRGDPYLFNFPNANSSLMHSSFFRTLGAIAGPRAQGVMAFLAAAQIDQYGNINSSRGRDGRLIVGSGGANDLTSGGADCMVVMPLRQGRFVETLPFVTSPTSRLYGVATDRCWFVPSGPGEKLKITAIMANPGDEDDTIQAIRAVAGESIAVHDSLQRFDLPSESELALVRGFDPQRILLS